MKLKQRRNRFLATVLALNLLLAMLPVGVQATQDQPQEHTDHTGWTALTNVGLSAYEVADPVAPYYRFAGEGETKFFYLEEDVTLSCDIRQTAGTVWLCLNGHVIDGDAQFGIYLSGTATMHICDCNGADLTHCFTDVEKYTFYPVNEEFAETPVSGKDGCFETYDDNYNTGGKTFGTDYIKIGGGAITNMRRTSGNSHIVMLTDSSCFCFHGGTFIGNRALGSSGSIVSMEREDGNVGTPSFTMQGGLIAGNWAAATGGNLLNNETGNIDILGGTIAYNTVGLATVMSVNGDSDAPLTLRDCEIRNNTITGETTAAAAVLCFNPDNSGTLGGNLIIRDNFCNGKQRNLRVAKGSAENDSMFFLSASFALDAEHPLTSEAGSVGISPAYIRENGEDTILLCETCPTGAETVFFSDEPTWKIENSENALYLKNRVSAQPSEGNGYTFSLDENGLASVSYAWYKAQTQKIKLDESNVLDDDTIAPGDYDEETETWQYDPEMGEMGYSDYFLYHLGAGDTVRFTDDFDPTVRNDAAIWLLEVNFEKGIIHGYMSHLPTSGDYTCSVETEGDYGLYVDYGGCFGEETPLPDAEKVAIKNACVEKVTTEGTAVSGQTTRQYTGSESGTFVCVATLTDTRGIVRTLTSEPVEAAGTTPPSPARSGGGGYDGSEMWAEKNGFTDVPEDAYYAPAVDWAVAAGVTEGTDATHFTPGGSVTRAQVVTFLWRAAGSPSVNYAMDMTDVPADAYYAEAVRWALANGVTKGVTDTAFAPNAPCTRAQIVTLLARYNGVADAVTESDFADVRATDYFAAAVGWAKKNGVTDGISATCFAPHETCTRAQTVTFLYRMPTK